MTRSLPAAVSRNDRTVSGESPERSAPMTTQSKPASAMILTTAGSDSSTLDSRDHLAAREPANLARSAGPDIRDDRLQPGHRAHQPRLPRDAQLSAQRLSLETMRDHCSE